MDSLNFQTGIKRLKINGDENNVLEFNPSDVTFVEGYQELMKDFRQKMDDLSEKSKAIEAVKEEDENGIPINMSDRVALLHESCDFIEGKIDQVFGDGTSKRLFNGAKDLDAYGNFLTAFARYIDDEREEKMRKYIVENKKGKRVMD